jgi:hypothetical protein
MALQTVTTKNPYMQPSDLPCKVSLSGFWDIPSFQENYFDTKDLLQGPGRQLTGCSDSTGSVLASAPELAEDISDKDSFCDMDDLDEFDVAEVTLGSDGASLFGQDLDFDEPIGLPPGLLLPNATEMPAAKIANPVLHNNAAAAASLALGAAMAETALTSAGCDQMSWIGVSTVMMRNLPNRLSQKLLISTIDSAGFANTYDFLYLPIDPRTHTNRGYAFINFTGKGLGLMFKVKFDGWKLQNSKSEKNVDVVPAKVQGFEANHKLYSKSRNNQLGPDERPLFLREPKAKKNQLRPKPKLEAASMGMAPKRQILNFKPQKSMPPPGLASTQIEKQACYRPTRGNSMDGHTLAHTLATYPLSSAGVENAAGFCTSCGGMVREHFKFCRFCGSSVSQVRRTR